MAKAWSPLDCSLDYGTAIRASAEGLRSEGSTFHPMIDELKNTYPTHCFKTYVDICRRVKRLQLH